MIGMMIFKRKTPSFEMVFFKIFVRSFFFQLGNVKYLLSRF